MCDPDRAYFRAHFPYSDDYNLEYFNQLFSEKRVLKSVGGSPQYIWQSIRKRNEALDCRVYAYCALKFILPRWDNYKTIFTPKQTKTEVTRTIKRKRRRSIWDM